MDRAAGPDADGGPGPPSVTAPLKHLRGWGSVRGLRLPGRRQGHVWAAHGSAPLTLTRAMAELGEGSSGPRWGVMRPEHASLWSAREAWDHQGTRWSGCFCDGKFPLIIPRLRVIVLLRASNAGARLLGTEGPRVLGLKERAVTGTGARPERHQGQPLAQRPLTVPPRMPSPLGFSAQRGNVESISLSTVHFTRTPKIENRCNRRASLPGVQ